MAKVLATLCLALALTCAAWGQEVPAPADTTEQAAAEAPPAAGEPAPVEEPAVEEPVTAEPPVEEPAIEEPVTAEPAVEEGPPITAVEIRGNQAISAQVIAEAVSARVGDAFTPQLARANERAVRDLGWFYDVAIGSEPSEQGVLLVVNVVENPVVKGVVIEGNTVFSDDELRAVMQTAAGQVSNNKVIIRDLGAVLDKYNAAGYIFARVIDVTTDDQGNLLIELVEGTVEEVRVTGNDKTRRHVIVREMRTAAGDVLNQEVLRRDLDRLINLDIFQDISAQPTVGSAPGLVVVTVNVVEKKTGLAAAGVGYSSVQKLVGFVDLAESNLRGSAQKVTLRTEFGGRESYELGYFNPWIAAPSTSLRVGLYNKTILRQAFADSTGFLYDEKRTGGNVTWSRPLRPVSSTRIFATLRADAVSVRESDAAALPEVIALQRAEDIRSIALALRNDTRNIIANPTQGGLNSLSTEFAGFMGGARFNKFGGDFRRYYRVGGKRVLALRLLLGFATGDPPFLEQYLLGGGETLRGYRNDRFPGTRMALVNAELRLPIQESLAGVLFVDVGDAWGGNFARELGDTTFTTHLGWGVGVRIITPIGPIRIDYGIGSEGQETHFSVGHAF